PRCRSRVEPTRSNATSSANECSDYRRSHRSTATCRSVRSLATSSRETAVDQYADYPDLSFDRPSDGVLRITLDGPGLNAVDPKVHRQLADVWLAVDRD